jgi:hypothetical protein
MIDSSPLHLAVITHGALTLLIRELYPELDQAGRDQMFIAVLERLARMRGWAIKMDYFETEDAGE